MDYFRLPRPLWRKLKKCLPKKTQKEKEDEARWQAQGLRPGRRQRYLVCALDRLPVEGGSSGLVWGLLQRYPRTFSEMEADGRLREANEKDGRVLRQRTWRDWLEVAGMDSKSSAAPLGGEKTGRNPTDRGKRGAKINLLVDHSGAPLSVGLTGANRHDKVAAIDLIVSMSVKRPAHKEQHLCADKAYDSEDMREFAASGGYITHIKVNPRRKRIEQSPENDSSKKIYPARRWVVERTISWLVKRRSLRTRWAKKAGNWLALIQLACAHILLNLAVFG